MSDYVAQRPLASVGFGFASFFGFLALLLVIVVATVLLAVLASVVTLTGLIPVVIVLGICSILLLVAGYWFVGFYLATVIVSVVVGRSVLGIVSSSLSENRILSLILGLVILVALGTIPYVGPSLNWIVVFFGLGAFLMLVFGKRTRAVPPANKKSAIA